MKKVLIGLGWFAIFFFGISFIVGGIVGFRAGLANPANGAAAGAEAGRVIGEKLGGFIFLASIIMAAIGTISGKLPGTKKE